MMDSGVPAARAVRSGQSPRIRAFDAKVRSAPSSAAGYVTGPPQRVARWTYVRTGHTVSSRAHGTDRIDIRERFGDLAAEAEGAGVSRAFTTARLAAEEHMQRAHRAGISWREETISELLWVHAHPHIFCADFTRHEESRVGADWLWWWIDDTGECFGMLVQAKRLHHSAAKQPVPELDYTHGQGGQFRSLMATANNFQVPAVYALYFGAVESRLGLTCISPQHGGGCEPCRRRSVSVITGLQVGYLLGGSKRDAAAQSFMYSAALEDLAPMSHTHRPVLDVNLKFLRGNPLREFLLQEQSGARHVAREIFRIVSEMRAGQFSAATTERTLVDSGNVFNDLPQDSGHFSHPYFAFVLRGLRHELPDTVRRILDGARPGAELEGIAGVVVVRC